MSAEEATHGKALEYVFKEFERGGVSMRENFPERVAKRQARR